MVGLTIYPGYGNGLTTGNEEERDITGTVGVNQLKEDYPPLKHEQQKQSMTHH